MARTIYIEATQPIGEHAGAPAYGIPAGAEASVLTAHGSDQPPTFEPIPAIPFVGARVTQSAPQAVGANTVLSWDVENYDTDNLHANAPNPSRLTAPESGYYLIQAMVDYSATGFTDLRLRLNGSTVIANMFPGVETGAPRLTVITPYFLSTSDYVEVVTTNTGGGTTQITNNSTFFAMSLLGS